MNLMSVAAFFLKISTKLGNTLLHHVSFFETLKFSFNFFVKSLEKVMFCSYIINGCTGSLEIVVKCGHFISVYIQHFNVANAL